MSRSAKSLVFLIAFVPVYIFLSLCFSDVIHIVTFNTLVQTHFDIIMCLFSLGLVLVLRCVGFDWLSAPSVLLVYIWLFHFGTSLFTSLDSSFWKTCPWGEKWVLARSWHEALLYSSLCCLAFTIGCLYAAIRNKQNEQEKTNVDWENKNLFYAGMICFCLGAMLILKGFIACGGFSLFSMDYVTVLTIFGPNSHEGIAFASIGIFMAASAAPRRMLKWVIFCQLPITLLYLALGMRTMALPAPLVLFVVFAKRGMRLPWWKLALIVVAFLWTVIFVKEVRQLGKGFAGVSSVSIGSIVPLDAAVEMGTTLQVVSLVFQWIDGGEDYKYGAGYWAGVERVKRLIGIRDPIADSAEGDPRTLAYLVSTNGTGYGGTNIGESYLNFSHP